MISPHPHPLEKVNLFSHTTQTRLIINSCIFQTKDHATIKIRLGATCTDSESQAINSNPNKSQEHPAPARQARTCQKAPDGKQKITIMSCNDCGNKINANNRREDNQIKGAMLSRTEHFLFLKPIKELCATSSFKEFLVPSPTHKLY